MIASVAPAGSPPAPGWMEVYSLVCVEGYSVPDAAAMLNLPPEKVRQARNQVLTWLATNRPLLPERSKEEAQKLAEALERERLEHLYAEAMEAWKNSQQDEVQTRQEGLMARTTRTVRTSHGKVCYLNMAAKISEMLLKIPVRFVPAWMEEGEAANEPIRFELDAGQRAARARNASGMGPTAAPPPASPPEEDCSAFARAAYDDDDPLGPSFDVMLKEFETNGERRVLAEQQMQARARLFTPVQGPETEATEEDEDDEEDFDDAADRLFESSANSAVPLPAERPSLLPKQTRRPMTRKERRARQKMLQKAKKRNSAG